MDILHEIAEYTKVRIENEKKEISLEEVRSLAERMEKTFAFEKALKADAPMAFICECKKASPSKGLIAEKFPHLPSKSIFFTSISTLLIYVSS